MECSSLVAWRPDILQLGMLGTLVWLEVQIGLICKAQEQVCLKISWGKAEVSNSLAICRNKQCWYKGLKPGKHEEKAKEWKKRWWGRGRKIKMEKKKKVLIPMFRVRMLLTVILVAALPLAPYSQEATPSYQKTCAWVSHRCCSQNWLDPAAIVGGGKSVNSVYTFPVYLNSTPSEFNNTLYRLASILCLLFLFMSDCFSLSLSLIFFFSAWQMCPQFLVTLLFWSASVLMSRRGMWNDMLRPGY